MGYGRGYDLMIHKGRDESKPPSIDEIVNVLDDELGAHTSNKLPRWNPEWDPGQPKKQNPLKPDSKVPFWDVVYIWKVQNIYLVLLPADKTHCARIEFHFSNTDHGKYYVADHTHAQRPSWA